MVCADRPQKTETKRVRWTVNGNRIDYASNLTTPTANSITVKTHINSTISTPGARYCTMDIKYFYLGTLMTEFEYFRVLLSAFPEEIIK